MKIHFKFPQTLFNAIHRDLSRPHAFAAERVGFIACGVAANDESGLLVLAETYHPVADQHYAKDLRVGAMMNSGAIRTALEIAYNRNVAMFHVHRHEHYGHPRLSKIDRQESAKFIPDFFKVRGALPHGVIVLSNDSATGLCWADPFQPPMEIKAFSVVGPQSPALRELA
jgi:hypothetical protein